MRLALFFCPKARTGGETWQKSSKVEGRLQNPASSVGDDARIVPRYITLFARLNLLPPIPPCGPMTSIGPYKPFAMFAAISKVSLRQGEGILLYKYF